MRTISNNDDVIDSRDVIARIEELEEERQDLLDEDDAAGLEEWDTDNGDELAALRALAEEASGSPDWEYGEALIRRSYFKEYAQELADDCGMVPDNLSWPLTCIDWDQAARELEMDYFSVDFDGVEYLIRS